MDVFFFLHRTGCDIVERDILYREFLLPQDPGNKLYPGCFNVCEVYILYRCESAFVSGYQRSPLVQNIGFNAQYAQINFN